MRLKHGLESVIHDISEKCEQQNELLLSLLHTPETTKNFSDKFSNLSIVVDPEFLTEKKLC